MPWQNQGGPWGGGGSNNGGGGGPWGGGGNRGAGGGGGGRGPQPPDFDEMIRKSQERLRRLAPKGGDKILIALLIILGVGLWLVSGFYRVEADEQGVVTRFGKFVRLSTPGLQYHLPYPIEDVQTPKVTRINEIAIGAAPGNAAMANDPSTMLTGDSKIVEVRFNVFWKINNAGDYLFQIRTPETTIRAAAESVMREIVGQNNIDFILTDGRTFIAQQARTNLQTLLDDYRAGVTIETVEVNAEAPSQVIDAFRDVQRAAADKDRLQRQAEAYARDIVPRARGEAAKQIQEAEAYKNEVLARATGDANRFTSVYQSYTQAKEVTQKRIYLETMEQVLRNANKVIMDNDGAGSGVVPYLPLPEIAKRQQTRTGQETTQ